jgi:EF hand
VGDRDTPESRLVPWASRPEILFRPVQEIALRHGLLGERFNRRSASQSSWRIKMNAISRSLAITGLITIAGFTYTSVYADDMTSVAPAAFITSLRTMDTMHMIDTDHDGTISQEEWTAFQNRVFSMLDRNNTGFVDAKEFYGDPMGAVSFAPGAFIQGLRTKAMFDKIGANADGKISRAQYMSYQQKIFDMMDTGKKKQLTATDFITKP